MSSKIANNTMESIMTQIRFNEPFITGNELKYIEDVFTNNQFYGNGKYTELCTTYIKKRLNAKNVLLTDSCTSALEISALLMRDTNIEQEIILPSYTFSSTASAYARAGFKLVFAEIDPQTMMLDLDDVKSRISDKTTAIVVVHYGGYCAQIKEFRELCDQQNLKLVEDAAQAFDCYLGSEALGTFGDFGCFSFHETKNIHAGLSGALLIKDDTLTDRATHIWERGTNRQEVLKGIANKYTWVEIGGSFYPTEMQAAFLYAQLEAVDRNIRERKGIYTAYLNGLSNLKLKESINFPDFQKNYKSNYHAFFVTFNSEASCDKVREYLVANKVAAYIGYVPLHSSPVGISMGNTVESLPVTELTSKCLLRLPFHNNMTLKDVTSVCNLIKGCIND
jgi:dTDP-4-amino-4,6-dideoxygalactose transaminase